MWELFKKDWDEVTKRVRYAFYLGMLLLFIAWLVDHWSNWSYSIDTIRIIGFDLFRKLYLVWVGLILIFGSIAYLVYDLIYGQPKDYSEIVKSYKKKYPQSLIGKDIILYNITDTGKVYLADSRSKTYHWIGNYTTAQDLDLVNEWKDILKHPFKKTTADYKEGAVILTRGEPGHDPQ